MEDAQKHNLARRSSGLLVSTQSDGESRALCEAISRLRAVIRAVSNNLCQINSNLARVLLDKEDIEELERMLHTFQVEKA